MDPHLVELGARIDAADDAVVEEALPDAALVVEAPDASEDARRFLRARLVDAIDRGPTRPVAASAIWVLGKLYDPSLVAYFTSLATIFVQAGGLANHIRQTLIALDNLELVPAWRRAHRRDEPDVMHQIAVDFLAGR